MTQDGTIEVVIGTQPSGQGHETSFAQVVADMLQVPVEKVWIILGDTDIVSVGGGSHSGRSMRHAGTVMAMASAGLLVEGKNRAAELFGASSSAIEFEDGFFKLQNSNKAIDIFELAECTFEARGPLRVAQDNEMHTPVFPNGTAICEVEVDPDTGSVQITAYSTIDDVGRCINPMIVHGQTHGGIAQGVGQAMWELCAVDPVSGQPMAGSLMDYGMPRFDNLPSFNCEIAEVLSPTNPLGIKAGGEGGTTPALVTVTNAVIDALKDFGVTQLPMPLTPFTVWKAIHRADKHNQGDKIPMTDKQTVRVIAFPGAPNLPTFAAIEKGFFAEEGLDIDLTLTPNSVAQAQRTAAGEFDIIFTAFDNVVAYGEGQGEAGPGVDPHYVVIMGATQLELAVIASPDVVSYPDLKGKTIALDALSTGFAFVLYEMTARGGLKSGDVTYVPVGATPQRWQSVKSGEHAATLTIEPFTSIARRSGFNVLGLSSDIFESYQGGVVAARRPWAEQNPQIVEAFIRAYRKGLGWTLSPANRPAAEQILQEKMPEIQSAALQSVMNSVLSPRSGLTPEAKILPEGMLKVLDLRSRYGRSGAVLTDPKKYLDLGYYQAVIR